MSTLETACSSSHLVLSLWTHIMYQSVWTHIIISSYYLTLFNVVVSMNAYHVNRHVMFVLALET